MYTSRNVIFKNKSGSDKDLFFCILCKFPHLSFEDFTKSKNWNGICHDCYLTFAEARKKEWKDGWRPDKETLETHIYNRKCQLIPKEQK